MLSPRQIVTSRLLAVLVTSPAGIVWSEEAVEHWEKAVFHGDEMRNALGPDARPLLPG
jgi:hypothetical protein